MKKCVLAFFLLGCTVTMQAQTWSEWFKQKKTQIKYLLQQIAANQVYIDQLQKGYSIAREGLGFINDVKQGHLQLDELFFSSLEQVSGEVRNYHKVGQIVSANARILQLSRSTRRQLQQSGLFSQAELAYVDRVVNGLLDGCVELTEGLMLIVTPAKLKMTDDERIERIDGLYEESRQRQAFLQSFADQCKTLAVAKQREERETALIRELYGISP